MSRRATFLAISFFLTLLGNTPTAPAQQKSMVPDADPVAATWVWLADAPLNEQGVLIPPQCPGSAAFEAATQAPGITNSIRNPKPLVRPALATRLGTQLSSLPAAERAPLIAFLSEHEDLAAEVALLLEPRDDIPAAWRVLVRLIETHGERVAELAPLAAAICAVHDQPRDRRIHERLLTLIDPVALFDYYSSNERLMRFSLTETPATLLLHLADATGTIEEYDWARKRYRRDADLSRRYAEIAYDTAALREEDAPAQATDAGEYSLQTIHEHGGVCADRAYFAQSVGKAIGVPACSIRGRGGEVLHAWVGFLEQRGRTGIRWNLSAGSTAGFEDARGTLLDPQTGETIPDAFLAMSAVSTSIPLERRRQSVALVDAATRLGVVAHRGGGDGGIGPEVTARQLDLLESAVRIDPGNLRAWVYARTLVASPASSLARKEHWTQVIDQLAAQTHPGFAFEIIAPIFASEVDLDIRYNLWDWAATRFASLPDLAVRARLAQVRIMIEQERKPEAILAAHAVVTQYSGTGPHVLEALALAERLLDETGQQEEIITMYKQAFGALKKPRRLEKAFLQQTSWFQIGSRYAELLEAAGETRQAEKLRRRLGQ